MKKKIEEKYLWCIIALYCIGEIMLFPHFRYYVDPDGISYINIAEKYFHGDYKNAINGFWSPLISWLICALLYLGVQKIVASKLIGVLIGCIGILVTNSFAQSILKNKTSILLAVGTVAALLLLYVQLDIAVDSLSAIILLHYLHLVHQKKWLTNTKSAIFIGITGALGYFSKYYIFPFFLLHFLLIAVYEYVFNQQIQWYKLLQKISIVLLVFFLIVAPWIYLISTKYQTGVIFSTTGKIDFSWALNNQIRNINYSFDFFIPPPNPTATDFTEDAFYVQGKYVQIFDSKETLKTELHLIQTSLHNFWNIINDFSFFFIPILVIAILILLNYKTNTEIKKLLIFFVGTSLIYCSGYWLLQSEHRYFYIINFFAIIIGCWLIETFILSSTFTSCRKFFILITFSFSFFITPIKWLLNFENHYCYIHQISQQLKKDLHLKGTVLGEGGIYADTHYACFAANLQNVIINPSHWNERERLKDELINNKIDYYFYWHWKADQSDSLKSFYGFEEITKQKIYGLQIFKISK